ncbi:MAG: hypothetical protein JJU31_12035 [Wenzhouxiangella sp.]|nr:hypothetical protein [Wenzhouxiangella sp.]MCH8476571.1 hypothetical protein [Wenzhouxiangella sp.]
MEQIEINERSHFEALLSDEVVMEWLMTLESEQAETEEVEPLRQYHA